VSFLRAWRTRRLFLLRTTASFEHFLDTTTANLLVTPSRYDIENRGEWRFFALESKVKSDFGILCFLGNTILSSIRTV
jgi:hypothetical protein